MFCCVPPRGSALKRITHGLTVGRKNPFWRISSKMNKWRKQVMAQNEQYLISQVFIPKKVGPLKGRIR